MQGILINDRGKLVAYRVINHGQVSTMARRPARDDAAELKGEPTRGN